MTRWLVTGCSSGIGREVAAEALARGHQVVVTARCVDAVEDLVAQFPDQALAVALDVTDPVQIREAVARTKTAFGGLDVLVNNAGYGYMAAVEEGEDDEVRRLFETNYFGVVNLIKEVLPAMRAEQSGRIINISSMTGLVANPPNVYYSSTKFALEALTECLAKELAPFGIRVCAVEPGGVRTDWASRSMKETGRPMPEYDATVGLRREQIKARGHQLVGDPSKVARAIVDLAVHPDPPLRLLLGRDVLAAYRQKLAETSASIDAWEAVTTGIDHDPEDVQPSPTFAG